MQAGSHQDSPKSMNIKITKGNDRDWVEARRPDGTLVKSTFPKKLGFPHDLVHLTVEIELKYNAAFWGRVADGGTPNEIAAISKTGGHASSRRGTIPHQDVIELIAAERIVECFEAELLSEPTPLQTFHSVLSSACAESKIAPPHLSEEQVTNIRAELQALMSRWQTLRVGQSLLLAWPVPET